MSQRWQKRGGRGRFHVKERPHWIRVSKYFKTYPNLNLYAGVIHDGGSITFFQSNYDTTTKKARFSRALPAPRPTQPPR